MRFIRESFALRPRLWLVAAAVSAALLAAVILQADGAQLKRMLADAAWPYLGAAMALLSLEGLFTAARIRLFAHNRVGLRAALKANAWYVLLLVLLPARLGEVAAVVVFKTHLGQTAGAAAASVVVQRLYDVMVLATLFLIALTGLSGLFDRTALALVAVALLAVSTALVLRMDLVLTPVAAWLAGGRRRRRRAAGIGRLAMQARRYVRHGLRRRDIPMVLALTTGKWAANLAALMLLLAAIRLGLSLPQSAVVAGAYNFLAIVPLQTIGGLGVGEAGLALLLGAVGLDPATAAGASLLTRAVIVLFPFVFWALVMAGTRRGATP